MAVKKSKPMQLQNQSHTQRNQLTMNQWNLQNNFLVFTNQSGAKVKPVQTETNTTLISRINSTILQLNQQYLTCF